MANTFRTDLMYSDSFMQAYTMRAGSEGETLYFQIYDNGIAYVLTGSTVTFKAETPLGHYIEKTAKIGSGNVVTVTTDKNMGSETGYYKRAYIEIKKGDVTRSTADIIFYVLPEANITGGNAQDYIDRVQAIIDEINAKYDEMVKQLNAKYAEFEKTLQAEFDKYKAQIKAQYDAYIKQLQDELTKALNLLNDFMTQVTNDLTEVNAKIDAINTKLATIDTGLKALETRMTELEARMKDLITNGAITKAEATNLFMNIRNTPVTNNDWNTLTAIGTYSVEQATGANMPNPNTRWGTLLVQGKQHDDNMLTQLFIGDTAVYFRRKMGPNSWNAWKKLGEDTNAMVKVSTPVVAQDWNTLTTVGTYSVLGATGANRPDSASVYGTLLVQAATDNRPDSGLTQLFITQSELWFRRRQDATTWNAWVKPTPQAATAEDIITGESDTLMVTPKGLKEAVLNTKQFKEYFGRGKEVQDTTSNSTGYNPIPIGTSVGAINEIKRPYTINADGSLTLIRDATLDITLSVKVVAGRTVPTTPFLYWYIMNPQTQLPTGLIQTDVEIVSFGSTRNTDGILNYNWIASGSKTLSLPAGTIINFHMRTNPNAVFRLAQIENVKIEEVVSDISPSDLSVSSIIDGVTPQQGAQMITDMLETHESNQITNKKKFTIDSSNSTYIKSGSILLERVGDTCFMSGIINNSVEIPTNTSILTTGTLPDWFNPESNRNAISIFSGKLTNCYYEAKSHKIMLDSVAVPANSWLALNASSFPAKTHLA